MYITLYARAMNGKVKIWRAEQMSDHIATWYGYFGGNLANHATAITMKDSHSQLLSTIKKKKKEGYKDMNDIVFLSKEAIPHTVTKEWLLQALPENNLDDNYNPKVMKCQKFKKGKFKYPAIAQPKANGVRGTMRWETIRTDNGMFTIIAQRAVIRSIEGLIYHVPHITDGITHDFFIDTETGMEVAWDGELYLHGTPLNMINSASPLIMANGTISKTRYPHITPQLKFTIFDIATADLVQKKRIDMVNTIIPFVQYEGVTSLPSIIVYNDAEALAYAALCITKKYEGAVLRNMDAEYKFGSRPMTMMKIKNFYDAEFEVIDIIPKPREPETALFVLRNDINDELFECNPMGSYAERKSYLDNKAENIGKMATVKYAERSGIKSVPFHANVVTVRKYE